MKSTNRRPGWIVRLGEVEWKRFTYGRANDALEMLGSVRHGPQVGALAKTADGEFVQVVGDYLTPLKKYTITKALAQAQSLRPKSCAPRWNSTRESSAAAAPVVIVKRRRTYMPG